MQLKIKTVEIEALRKALVDAGSNEIGGQLFGEQLSPSNFLVTELTIQKHHGSFSRFIVDLVQAAKDAASFFMKTNRNYKRFNYIGEWHSHPSFAVAPSRTDSETMRNLVSSSDFAGTFAALIIVKLKDGSLEAAGWVYDPTGREAEIQLEMGTND